ncbi:MAG: glycogen-debranching protein [Verrucomicrobia bacterium]|nr:glycogen-debranching protein [Verrucomicrobiota bacterium]
MQHQVRTAPGGPTPLGVSNSGSNLNFSLYSSVATKVVLSLFLPGDKRPFASVPLSKTGQVWHVEVGDLPTLEIEYGYTINDGPLVSDPYAKGLSLGQKWGATHGAPRGKVVLDPPFDWQGITSPQIPMQDLIIYEMHVRAFTVDPSSKVKFPGTYQGMIEKIPYLKKLGINAVELLPIFEFDECQNHATNPLTGERLYNFWGYSTINFFCPMNRFASSKSWTAAITDFKTLVRELHRAGIEVILDVVYNHTAEGGKDGPIYSYKGIDKATYYMLRPDGTYIDFSGTGNTFNANHPIVSELIIDSLRYWVSTMQVDGFRFDLASCLTRDEEGHPLADPYVIRAISEDPILASTKLIAEAWDIGMYQVGNFPGGKRWSEWNGKYRDSVRRFLKGSDGGSSAFARALSGSDDLYGKERNPYHSINFIIAHDGYTLRDLVSYQDKHNLANGEENRDGNNQNDSWNCGAEGKTKDPKILHLRERQIRNFHTALMLSLGTPMILMGDEYGHTRGGNNNPYCQDNALNWFLWNEIDKHTTLWRFYHLLIEFRKAHPVFQRTEFFKETDIDWHGYIPLEPNWGPENRFIAYTLKMAEPPLYIAFNAHFQVVHAQLPPPPKGKTWCRVIDTSLASPLDFSETPERFPIRKGSYDVIDHSAIVLKAL